MVSLRKMERAKNRSMDKVLAEKQHSIIGWREVQGRPADETELRLMKVAEKRTKLSVIGLKHTERVSE